MWVSPLPDIAMPMSASEAATKYRNGISSVGADAYRRASNTNSPEEAARILEDAKTDGRLSIDSMASSYEDAYTGV